MEDIAKTCFGISLFQFSDYSAKETFSFDSVLRMACLAEKLGFDSVWIADHAHFPFEALSILSSLVMRTKTVKLGTAVIDANRRSPAMLAHITSTLDWTSGGRLILGVGSGVWNDSTYGFHIDKPVSRMKESIEILKKFWVDDEVTYHGEFFEYERASIGLKPFQKPHPPLWIAGFGSRIKRIAAELGNGFITQNISPGMYREELMTVRNSAIKLGKDPADIKGVFVAPMAVSKNSEDAERMIKPMGASFLVRRGRPPFNFSRKLGYESSWNSPDEVPSEALDRCFIYGTPNECLEKVLDYIKAGVEYFVALPLLPKGEKSVRLFSEKVLSNLN